MRRASRATVVATVALIVLSSAVVAQATLPAEQPDITGMVSGKVRAIAQASGDIWLGGTFGQVKDTAGNAIRTVDNFVALNSNTGQLDTSVHQAAFTDTGGGAIIHDISLGPDGNLYVAGKFTDVDGVGRKNVAAIDPGTGDLLPFNPGTNMALSILATSSAVYVGTDRLLSFQLNGTATPGYSSPVVQVNAALRAHTTPPQFRDIDIVGRTLVAACQCDSLTDDSGTHAVKALVQLDADTGDLNGWRTNAFTPTSGAFGISLIVHDSPSSGLPTIYLAAGGSDFTAAFDFANGTLRWRLDTSGSSQAITWWQGDLVVGGHFNWSQSPASSGGCGDNDHPNTDCYHSPKLIAIDPATGAVRLKTGGDPWNPGICCKYNGVWALLTDANGNDLHVGGEFTHAGGAWVASGGTWQLNGSSDHDYYARFSSGTSFQSVAVTVAGSGSVTSTPAGIDCPGVCAAYFDSGTNLTLTANPDSGADFSGWSGDCSGTGTCHVTLDQARDVTATFSSKRQLTVSKAGTGSGMVTSNPAGIDCGVDCTAAYSDGTDVTLTAAASSGATFIGWSGACSGVGSCVAHMTASRTVTATFTQNAPDSCGKLAFASSRAGNGDIFTMNPDRTQLRNLTDGPDVDTAPAWSPLCDKVAFSSTRGGNTNIFVVDADGTHLQTLTSSAGADTQPTWSPDGTRIAFTSDRTGNRELFAMDADGTHETQITTNTWIDQQPDWSPDGTALVFASNRDGPMQIYSIHPDGSHRARLTHGTVSADQPTWSPNGTRIAYVSMSSGTRQIWTMNADGTSRSRLTFDGRTDTHPSWSPNGSRLVFARNTLGARDLWIIPAAGSKSVQVTTSKASDVSPDWT